MDAIIKSALQADSGRKKKKLAALETGTCVSITPGFFQSDALETEVIWTQLQTSATMTVGKSSHSCNTSQCRTHKGGEQHSSVSLSSPLYLLLDGLTAAFCSFHAGVYGQALLFDTFLSHQQLQGQS